MIYRELGAFGLWEMVVFAGAVFFSFVYLLANGALDWGPVKRTRPMPAPAAGAERTTETTIRRVGGGRDEAA